MDTPAVPRAQPSPPAIAWPGDDVWRVPFQVYTDPAIYEAEQRLIFQGPTWNLLGVEAEIPNPGDYKTTHIGAAPVIVVRDENGEINALLNRCAHKGSLVCYKPCGNARELTCVYHNWVYDLRGKLTGVAFKRGVGGKGGLTEEFDQNQYGLMRLRVETYRGIIFGTFSQETPPFVDYIGKELAACIDRVMIKPLKVLGFHSQVLPNNWKLYSENTKDSYHASLLHVFHNTFGIVRAGMGGGIKLSPNGWNHLSWTERGAPAADQSTSREKVRSLKDQYKLADPAMMEHKLELGDQVTNSIQSVFPATVIQQIHNCLAVRQLVPRGVDRSELLWTILGFEDDDAEMLEHRLKANNLVGPAGFISMEDGCVGGWVQHAAEADRSAQTIMPMGGRTIEPSQGSRVTEAAVRGFWKGWRECMGV